MKTKDEELQLIWDDLVRVFMGYKKLTPKLCKRLEGLGYKITKEGDHAKVYMNIHGSERCMVISTTPSDKNAGRQILRQIRRMYEQD